MPVLLLISIPFANVCGHLRNIINQNMMNKLEITKYIQAQTFLCLLTAGNIYASPELSFEISSTEAQLGASHLSHMFDSFSI